MKKVLLIAATAFIACTAGAQTFASKSSKAKSGTLIDKALERVASFNGNVANATVTMFDDLKVNPIKNKIKRATHSLAGAQAIRKAGSIQQEYQGKAVSNSGEAAEWTMASGTATTGELLLSNVIPTPSEEQLPNVYVEYTISGSTITIEPQFVFSDGDYNVFICGYNEDTITFTLGDDGSISFDESDQIIYIAQDSQTYDATWETSQYHYGWYKNVRYYLPGQAIIPNADYKPKSFMLRAGCNTSWGYYSLLASPATAPMEFANLTDNYDETAWTINLANYVNGQGWAKGDVAESSGDVDFTFTPERGETYFVPELVASYEGNAGSPAYYLGETARISAGDITGGWNFGEGTSLPTWGNFDSSQGLTTAGTGGVDAIVAYQGKPGSPLYFRGINVLMYNFEQKDDFTMKCKIVKIERDANSNITIGETIAESDVDLDDIEVGTKSTRLNFNEFYAYDEEGMSYSLDYLQIEDEFAVVFEGVNTSATDATFSGSFLCYVDTERYAYAILAGKTEWEGYGWNGRKVLVGFTDAVFGYLYTEDDTDLTFEEAGGSKTIHVEPFLYDNEDENNPTTWWEIADEDNLPEWISLAVENEKYTEDEASFDLVVTVDPLEDAQSAKRRVAAAGRTATFDVVQPGGKLTITVTQGEVVNGIADVQVTKTTTDGKTYNVAGQRLNSNAKGLIVKDGKKYIVK